MGGLGSGRTGGWGRDTVEACRSLDIHRLQREGCLRPGWSGGWQWSRDGRQIGSVQILADDNRLHLAYRIRIGGGEWTDVAEIVPIARLPCRFGGSRPYFLCPGVVKGSACGRRVVKLYGADGYFLCRHCYRLGYASQREDALERTRRRAAHIRRQLGEDPAGGASFPTRPKGMWHRTFERLLVEALTAEARAEAMFDVKAIRLLACIERRHGEGSFWS